MLTDEKNDLLVRASQTVEGRALLGKLFKEAIDNEVDDKKAGSAVLVDDEMDALGSDEVVRRLFSVEPMPDGAVASYSPPLPEHCVIVDEERDS